MSLDGDRAQPRNSHSVAGTRALTAQFAQARPHLRELLGLSGGELQIAAIRFARPRDVIERVAQPPQRRVALGVMRLTLDNVLYLKNPFLRLPRPTWGAGPARATRRSEPGRAGTASVTSATPSFATLP